MKITDLLYKEFAKGLDFIEVVDVDNGGGYEWDEFHAWYSPTRRRYFWDYGSGCSCNSWGDNIDGLDDFENGNKADLARALRSYLSALYNAAPGESADAMRAVNTFRPTQRTTK